MEKYYPYTLAALNAAKNELVTGIIRLWLRSKQFSMIYCNLIVNVLTPHFSVLILYYHKKLKMSMSMSMYNLISEITRIIVSESDIDKQAVICYNFLGKDVVSSSNG